MADETVDADVIKRLITEASGKKDASTSLKLRNSMDRLLKVLGGVGLCIVEEEHGERRREFFSNTNVDEACSGCVDRDNPCLVSTTGAGADAVVLWM